MISDGLTRRSFLAGGVSACCGCIPLSRVFAATSAGDTRNLGSEGFPSLLELGAEPMKRIGQTVWVARLSAGLWMHTTTDMIAKGVYFPANGLILESRQGSVLIDAGYLPEHAEALL